MHYGKLCYLILQDHRPLKEQSRLFESFVVVGLHPNCDIQALQKQYFGRKSEGSGKFRCGQHQSRVESIVEPQVLILLWKTWNVGQDNWTVLICDAFWFLFAGLICLSS